MGTYATTVISFSEPSVLDGNSNGNSGVIQQKNNRAFESYGDSIPGTVVEMYVWASDQDALNGLSLRDGSFSVVSERALQPTETVVQETLSFSKANVVQTSYPSNELKKAIARTGIILLDELGKARLIASAGVSSPAGFELFDGSQYGTRDMTKLYFGSVFLEYVKGPHFLSWGWTVPNKAGIYPFYITIGEVILFSTQFEVSVDNVVDISPRNVSIKVKDHVTGFVLEGVTVTIAADDNTHREWHATTGADGIASFEAVDCGVYPITLEKDGYIINSDDDLDNDFIQVQ